MSEPKRFKLVEEVILPPARAADGYTNPTVKLMNDAYRTLTTRYLREIEKEAEGNRIVRYGLVLVRERDGQR